MKRKRLSPALNTSKRHRQTVFCARSCAFSNFERFLAESKLYILDQTDEQNLSLHITRARVRSRAKHNALVFQVLPLLFLSIRILRYIPSVLTAIAIAHQQAKQRVSPKRPLQQAHMRAREITQAFAAMCGHLPSANKREKKPFQEITKLLLLFAALSLYSGKAASSS